MCNNLVKIEDGKRAIYSQLLHNIGKYSNSLLMELSDELRKQKFMSPEQKDIKSIRVGVHSLINVLGVDYKGVALQQHDVREVKGGLIPLNIKELELLYSVGDLNLNQPCTFNQLIEAYFIDETMKIDTFKKAILKLFKITELKVDTQVYYISYDINKGVAVLKSNSFSKEVSLQKVIKRVASGSAKDRVSSSYGLLLEAGIKEVKSEVKPEVKSEVKSEVKENIEKDEQRAKELKAKEEAIEKREVYIKALENKANQLTSIEAIVNGVNLKDNKLKLLEAIKAIKVVFADTKDEAKDEAEKDEAKGA